MKLNFLFKTLIDIAFFLMVPVVIFFPGTILYMLFFPQQEIINTNIPFMDNGVTFASVVFSIVLFVEFVLFFLGFFNLRKLATLTLKNKFFSAETVLRLKRIGQFFSICGGSSLILLITYKMSNAVVDNSIRIGFGFGETQLLLFLFIIGIFFLMLSSAFKRAIAYKTENELTV